VVSLQMLLTFIIKKETNAYFHVLFH